MDLSINMIQEYDKISAYSCNVCQKTFKHKRNLQFHKRLHNGELQFSCDICNKIFNQKVHLQNHKLIHTGELPFSCDICNKKFNQKHSMLNHRRTHSDDKMKYNCDLCNKTFTQQITMIDHKRAQHTGEKIFKCVYCERAFPYRQSLPRHIKKAHPDISTFSESQYYNFCNICKKSFNRKGTFKNHQNKHVHRRVRVNIKKLSDSLLWEDFTYTTNNSVKNELDDLTITEFKEEIKEEAIENSNDNEDLEDLDFFHESDFNECYASGIEHLEQGMFVEVKEEEGTERDDKDSIVKVHEETSIDELLDGSNDDFLDQIDNAKYCNEIRNVSSNTTKDLPTEQKTKQVSGIIDEEENMLSVNIDNDANKNFKRRFYIPGAFPCNVCLKTFDSYERLENHMKTEDSTHYIDNEEPTCRICGNSFSILNNLMIHTRSHLGITPYPCDVCDRSFIGSAQLHTHKKNVHKKNSLKKELSPYVKDIKTSIISKIIQNDNVTSNFNLENADRLKYSFYCEICNKSFEDLEELIKHNQTHGKKLDKESKRVMNTSLDIQDNQNNPNDKCVEHDKDNLKPTLEEIIISKIKPNSEQEKTDKLIELGEKNSDDIERPFKCKSCPKTFKEGYQLKNHNMVHSNVRPFVCDVCEKSFIRKDSLNVHKIIHLSVKPFGCDICNKRFTTKFVLKKHSLLHVDKKTFSCDICEKVFNHNFNFSRHKLEKHSDPAPFLCVYCNKSFPNIRELIIHKKEHNPKLPGDNKEIKNLKRKSLKAEIKLRLQKNRKRNDLQKAKKETSHLKKKEEDELSHLGESENQKKINFKSDNVSSTEDQNYRIPNNPADLYNCPVD